MHWPEVLEVIKLSPKYLFPVSLVGGFLLFAPASALETLGLVTVVTNYRTYIGLVFLVATAVVLTSWSIAAYQWLGKKRTESERLRAARARLHDLTREERAILRPYIARQTRTQSLDIRDGVVSGLVSEGILYRPSDVSRWALTVFDHNIQPWAWDYLNTHPELVRPPRKGASDESEPQAPETGRNAT